MATQIHWFPGHMKKALNEIEERIKIVDVVIELLDARAPLSSINDRLQQIAQGKKKLVVLTKPDLADPKQTELWKNKLAGQFDMLLVLDLTKGYAQNEIAKAVNKLGQFKHQKEIARGMKPQPIRAMILGIPNVGKSSLINRLAGRRAAGVQNKPGYTRGEQWIKVNKDFLLLDTPGVLPMNYEDHKKAANLALLGAIREDILPNHELVSILLNFLKEHYPLSLKDRFNIEEITTDEAVISSICDARKLVDANGNPDLDRAQMVLLKEFKDGLLGQITLERL